MKLDDLIKHYEILKLDNGDVNIDYVINSLKEFRILNKPCVDKFIADWYEKYKGNLEYNIWDWMIYIDEPEKLENIEFTKWLGDFENNHVETLVKMKLFGYKVKESIKYRVKLLETCQILYKGDFSVKFIDIFDTTNNKNYEFTKEELNNYGMAYVFNNKGFKVEEVK